VKGKTVTLEDAAKRYREVSYELENAVNDLEIAFQETEVAEALQKGYEDGLSDGRAGHDLFVRVNGLDVTDIEKRVDSFITMHLIGLTVTDSNQVIIRRALIEHFQYFQASLEKEKSKPPF